jgi:hypothetical protein
MFVKHQYAISLQRINLVMISSEEFEDMTNTRCWNIKAGCAYLPIKVRWEMLKIENEVQIQTQIGVENSVLKMKHSMWMYIK